MTNWKERISPAVHAVPPSGIRKYFDIAAEMEDVVSLGVGEPDFITPWSIRESCVHGLEQGYTSYTANRGMLELREEIAAHYAGRYGISYEPAKDILVTVGVSEALDIAMRAILSPGDEVLIPEPCYVSYQACVTFAGGKPIPVAAKLENDFRITPEELEPHVTKRTKALLIGYPNNPTGAVMAKDDLQKIAAFAEKHDLIVVSDEIYGDLTYGGMEHTAFSSLPGMKERTILLNGFSKAYAMTGWRIGYLAANAKLTKQVCKLHQYSTICAPIMSQYAAIEGLKNGWNEVERMRRSYEQRRNLMYKAFCDMGLPCTEGEGAFYLFPDIRSTGLTSEEFATQLIENYQVAVVPGTCFGKGGEGFIRCCYATDINKIKIAVSRIAELVAELRKKREANR